MMLALSIGGLPSPVIKRTPEKNVASFPTISGSPPETVDVPGLQPAASSRHSRAVLKRFMDCSSLVANILLVLFRREQSLSRLLDPQANQPAFTIRVGVDGFRSVHQRRIHLGD